ncbi:mitochondrial fission ELM1 family protein [Spongiibacter sp. KMU-158]|uniref:Mitochondrial fission ELM1 family protein n=1 Tax=Spongiibacter pelagi TaxID=2760804 RepID=A0A927C265_9GAMM|nr:ELM1/GtrOC1 family putative glycosyltransferase [Spongiibacter pelagi]MBD2859374.1 mitochondrial fission ELM1 family protein [Spongiibacter pelagi]
MAKGERIVSQAKPLRLWIVTEGRAGHVSMLLGFSRRLAEKLPLETHWLNVTETPFRYRGTAALLQQFGAEEKPDWILGTGSHCYWPMIWMRYVMGVKTIALQCPAQPLSLYSAVVAPEHDAPRGWKHVFVSQGVLNKIEPVTEGRDRSRGLILLGGINKHFEWDNAHIAEQIAAIASAQPNVQWLVSDSPRSPESLLPAIAGLGLANVSLKPFAECSVDWLQEQLSAVGQAWVSRDSVSMVYESLSAAAPTGMLHLEKKRDSRVTRCMDKVIERGQLAAYESAELRQPLPAPAMPLNETQRAVDWFIDFAKLKLENQADGERSVK